MAGLCATRVGAASKTANKAAGSRMPRIIILASAVMWKPLVITLLVAAALAPAQSARLAPSRDQAAVRGPSAAGQAEDDVHDWPFYGGDQGGAKYSALTAINRSNVSRLKVAWEWTTREKALETFGTRPGNFQATPIMIGNVLYVSTPYNRVAAINADTG